MTGIHDLRSQDNKRAAEHIRKHAHALMQNIPKSVKKYEYERNIADWLRVAGEIEAGKHLGGGQ